LDVEAVGVQVDAGGDAGVDVVVVEHDDEGRPDRALAGPDAGTRLVGVNIELRAATADAGDLYAAAEVGRGVRADGDHEHVLVPLAIRRIGILIDLGTRGDGRVAVLVEGQQREGAGDGDLGAGVGRRGLAPAVDEVVVQPGAGVEVGREGGDDILGLV